jgi:hypothetical protein
MSLRYTPILQAQPADGDVVFVRRWTRDPPVRATFLANMSTFITSATLNALLVGSTAAGTFTLAFSVSVPTFALPGWTATTGGVTYTFLTLPGGFWALAVLNGSGNGFWAPPQTVQGIWPATVTTIAFGANPFGAASRVALQPGSAIGLWLPAANVQAWRPL